MFIQYNNQKISMAENQIQEASNKSNKIQCQAPTSAQQLFDKQAKDDNQQISNSNILDSKWEIDSEFTNHGTSIQELNDLSLVKIPILWTCQKKRCIQLCQILTVSKNQEKYVTGWIYLDSKQIVIYEDIKQKNLINSFDKLNLNLLHKVKIIENHAHTNEIIKLYEKEILQVSCDLLKFDDLSISYALFASILTRKIELLQKQYSEIIYYKHLKCLKDIVQNSLVAGYIFKKSKYLGIWEKRFAVINQQGFYSYSDTDNAIYSYSIKSIEITQLWTRFQFYEGYLVIKVLAAGVKTEIAIPLVNFLKKNNNWLYWLHQLILRHHVSRGSKAVL